MKLIVVRHGLCQDNVDKVIGGQHDDNLTDEGKIQAQELANKLVSYGIEHIYSSPLKRTTETALPIAEKLDTTINIDRRLIEVSFGSFEGKPNEEFESVVGSEPSELLSSYQYDLREHGGESSTQVEKRVRAFIKDLKKQPFNVVLIVTHGGIVRFFHYICTGKKTGSYPNASIHVFKV